MVATRNCFSAPDTNTIIQVKSLNIGDKNHTEKIKITKKYFRKKNIRTVKFEKYKF